MFIIILITEHIPKDFNTQIESEPIYIFSTNKVNLSNAQNKS